MSAPLSRVPAPRRHASRSQPSVWDLERMPVAHSGEFELSDFETKQTRRLIYSINKQGRFRYRTLREGRFLQVWRIK
jgi:hypothetical protein